MEYRWGLILIAAIVVVATGTLAAVTIRQESTAVLLGFGGVMITQLLAMLRGHMGDVAATRDRRVVAEKLTETQKAAATTAQRLNGGLDDRIREAVTAVVDAKLTDVCGGVEDLRAELHKVKHDMRGLTHTHDMIVELLHVAAAERKPGGPLPAPPPELPGP